MSEPNQMVACLQIGGRGTHFWPGEHKHQQMLYDKPVLYYLLTNVMKARIRDIMIVCNERNLAQMQAWMLQADWEFGINVRFATGGPRGPAGLFRIPLVQRFIGNHPVCLMLDGVYHGGNFEPVVLECAQTASGATILAATTADPTPFGWLQTAGHEGLADEMIRILRIREKPRPAELPKNGGPFLVQTHMFFYGPEVVDFAAALPVSDSGELGVSELHRLYLDRDLLHVRVLRDTPENELIWDDAGSADRLLDLGLRIRNSPALVGSPHLQALENGWIKVQTIEEVCKPFVGKGNHYCDALLAATRRHRHGDFPGATRHAASSDE